MGTAELVRTWDRSLWVPPASTPSILRCLAMWWGAWGPNVKRNEDDLSSSSVRRESAAPSPARGPRLLLLPGIGVHEDGHFPASALDCHVGQSENKHICVLGDPLAFQILTTRL